eukprot:jgi/Ulvmu1/7663/UM038_0092.1
MHREGACAADALAAMIEAMDDTAFRADRGEGALGPVLQQPGYLTPAAVLPPEAGDPGGEGVQKRTTSPLQVVGGTVSHLPGDADPVGVAEKVAWMDSKDQAHGAPMEPPEGQDPLASSAAGVIVDLVSFAVIMQSLSLLTGRQSTSRISHACSSGSSCGSQMLHALFYQRCLVSLLLQCGAHDDHVVRGQSASCVLISCKRCAPAESVA